MKRVIAIIVFILSALLTTAQTQSTEFTKKIQAESAKNVEDKENAKENEQNIYETGELQLAPNLIVSKISFIGLKKTRNSYLQSKIKKFTGKPISQTDMHGLETAIQLEGLFEDIKITTEQISDNEAQITISVKEKITFIPLPFALYSDSSFIAGGVVMDTNAFGQKDMFMVGGFFSAETKTGLAAFSKSPKDHGIPGFALFFSGSKSIPLFKNLDGDEVLKFNAISFSTGLTITEKIGEYFTFSNRFNWKSYTTDENSDYPKAQPESIKEISTSLSFGYSKSDWNGIFMSTNSATISAEFGLSNSEDKEFRYPMGFSFSIGSQHPVSTPKFRIYQKFSGYYGQKNHISSWQKQSAGAVNILPSNFATQRIIGGNAGFEIALKKFSWGMISLYSEYQIVYIQNTDEKYEFEHGPNTGTKFYLAKIAFPALAMGLAYNVPHHRWQFSAAMGMSF